MIPGMLGFRKHIKFWLYTVAAILIFILMLVQVAPLLIFPGYFAHRPDAAYGCSQQRVEWSAADGTLLRGWFFNRGPGSPLVVIHTGNNMNVGAMLPMAEADTARSYLLLNYRGYGDSEGVPSESALVSDSIRNITHAQQLIGGQKSPLHIIGYSIGSGVATQVAAAAQPDTLTLICPFDCITEVACDFVPVLPRLLLPNTFNSAGFAPRITCPVTILRARHDTLVTAPHTATLLQAFPTPPTEHVLEADHNSIFADAAFFPLLYSSLER